MRIDFALQPWVGAASKPIVIIDIDHIFVYVAGKSNAVREGASAAPDGAWPAWQRFISLLYLSPKDEPVQ